MRRSASAADPRGAPWRPGSGAPSPRSAPRRRPVSEFTSAEAAPVRGGSDGGWEGARHRQPAGADAVLQLQHEPLGRLLAYSGIWSGGPLAWRMGRGQLRRRASRTRMLDAELGPTPGPRSTGEQLLFLRARETVRAAARPRGRACSSEAAHGRPPPEACSSIAERGAPGTRALHVEDHERRRASRPALPTAARSLRESPRQRGAPIAAPPRQGRCRNPARAAGPQMAAASASLASRRPCREIPGPPQTIRPTCSFSARPVPVTACLITLGAKLRTRTPAWAAASSATPRACPAPARTSRSRVEDVLPPLPAPAGGGAAHAPARRAAREAVLDGAGPRDLQDTVAR